MMEKNNEEFDQMNKDTQQNKKVKLPKKGKFRQRAHKNIFAKTAFAYPQNPDYVDWKVFYPKLFEGTTDEENFAIKINTADHPIAFKEKIEDSFNGKKGPCVDFVDVGCGYGGLLFSLSQEFPDKVILGMEIREKVTNYVGEKISGMRQQNPGKYNNIAVIKNNAQRHLTNFFRKGSLERLFFLFADPCFKKKMHRRRIINYHFLSEYAYLLKPKGRIYCITDVDALYQWEVEHLDKHPQFTRIPNETLKDDPCINFMHYSTEESMKVDREKRTGDKQYCVYERIEENDDYPIFETNKSDVNQKVLEQEYEDSDRGDYSEDEEEEEQMEEEEEEEEEDEEEMEEEKEDTKKRVNQEEYQQESKEEEAKENPIESVQLAQASDETNQNKQAQEQKQLNTIEEVSQEKKMEEEIEESKNQQPENEQQQQEQLVENNENINEQNIQLNQSEQKNQAQAQVMEIEQEQNEQLVELQKQNEENLNEQNQ